MFDYDLFNANFLVVNVDTIEQLLSYYHPDIHFVDPAHDLHGVEEIRQFWLAFTNDAENTTRILHRHQEGNRCYSSWQMEVRHARIGGGKPINVAGMSELLLQDEKVIYHRDHFDMGQLLYEHLPVMGWVIRKIKDNI